MFDHPLDALAKALIVLFLKNICVTTKLLIYLSNLQVTYIPADNFDN